MAWSKPNPQASGDKAGPLLLKEVANTIDIYAKLNLLKACHIGGSSPSGPDAGQLWMDNTATPHKLMRYTGSAWVRIADKHISLVTKVADYTLDDEDDVVLLDGTSVAVEGTLPTAVGISGRTYILKAINVDNACTVDADGSETIEGSAGYTFVSIGDMIGIISDGSNWRIFMAYTGRQHLDNAVVALTDGANIATDASLGFIFTVTIAGDRTLDNPTNPPVSGEKTTRIWKIKQDATGTRTLAFGSAFRFGTDIPNITLTTTGDKTDYIGAVYNVIDSKWDIVSFTKGY